MLKTVESRFVTLNYYENWITLKWCSSGVLKTVESRFVALNYYADWINWSTIPDLAGA